ncbi:MAG: hypothetical protein KA354_14315 [Phycisphaerae bacterium]|nr:hypothetical protein [Phycisphaerae bacterium]
MPYSPPPVRRVPVTRETVISEFTRGDGSQNTQGSFTKQTGPGPGVDVDVVVVNQKIELACGCYWPDAEVAGVCAECAKEGDRPNVCKTHYFVCACGTACCWKHSSPCDDGKTRICTRCHLREQNKAFKAAVTGKLAHAARWLFWQETG